MIIVELSDGLGNQLFQYALGRCLSHKLKTDLKLDLTKYKQINNDFAVHTKYKLGAFKIKENFAKEKDVEKANRVIETNFGIEHKGFASEVLNCGDNTLLEGLWQSESYFAEITDILKSEFSLRRPVGKNSLNWKKKILSTECAVAVHVRHGDYLRPYWRCQGILPLKYYATAINLLKEEFHNITLFIFSDDMEWCKSNFDFGVPTEFVEGCEHDFEEIHLMSCCRHNVVANSTFSWWGAWLNQNPDKKVFAPNPWLLSLAWKDIIPDRWIKIPVDYSTGIPPLLSIIMYIEDNLSTINSALQGVLNPIPINYEVILIDASTDGSSKICRQVAQDSRVNYVRAKFPTNKFMAWNRGLDIACGHQVLFTTAEDLILPQFGILADICDNAVRTDIMNKNKALNYKNYWHKYPNVVSTTQRLKPDANGAIKLNGIPDKNFSVKVDSAFQGLNTISEIKLTVQQKLTALGSNGINDLVGTKFFKRQFLNENKIRFNENEAVDAELKFIVDAFLSTEKITFVPAVFYGRFK